MKNHYLLNNQHWRHSSSSEETPTEETPVDEVQVEETSVQEAITKESVEDVSAEKSQVAATPVEEDEEDGPLEDWTIKELKEECKTLGLSDKGKRLN